MLRSYVVRLTSGCTPPLKGRHFPCCGHGFVDTAQFPSRYEDPSQILSSGIFADHIGDRGQHRDFRIDSDQSRLYGILSELVAQLHHRMGGGFPFRVCRCTARTSTGEMADGRKSRTVTYSLVREPALLA